MFKKKGISIPEVFITEFLLSFFLGCVPVFIMVFANINADPVDILHSINPGEHVLMYMVYLLGIHIVIWSIDIVWLKPNDSVSSIVYKLRNFSHKLGFAIHGIYRIFSGAIPTVLILLFMQTGLDQGWQLLTVASLSFSILCFFVSILLSLVTDATAPTHSNYHLYN